MKKLLPLLFLPGMLLPLRGQESTRLRIDGVSLSEGTAPQRTALATVWASETVSAPVQISWRTRAGSAVEGFDFLAASGTVILPAGRQSVDIPVTVRGDTDPEPAEEFYVDLTSASAGLLEVTTAAITLENDDWTGYYKVGAAAQFSEESGAVSGTISLSTAQVQEHRFVLGLRALEAMEGTDFPAQTVVVTIPAGGLNASFSLPLVNDATAEPSERLFIRARALTPGLKSASWSVEPIPPLQEHYQVRATAYNGSNAAILTGTDLLVFRRRESGAWTLEETLPAPISFAGEMVLSGETLLVPHDTAMSVYHRTPSGPAQWSHHAEIDLPFGTDYRVSLHRDTLAVCWGARGGSGAESSAVVIYERHRGGFNGWGQAAMLQRPAGSSRNVFGSDVAVYGQRAAIVAAAASGNPPPQVHIAERAAGGLWQLAPAALTAPAGTAFGTAVGWDGDGVTAAFRPSSGSYDFRRFTPPAASNFPSAAGVQFYQASGRLAGGSTLGFLAVLPFSSDTTAIIAASSGTSSDHQQLLITDPRSNLRQQFRFDPETSCLATELSLITPGELGIVITDGDLSPDIAVFNGLPPAPELFDGQATAVDFGTTERGIPRDRTFTVRNTGRSSLRLSGVVPPPGFTLMDSPVLPALISPGTELSIRIRMNATGLGSFGGRVVLANDDVDEPQFSFPVTGRIIPSSTQPAPAWGQPFSWGRNDYHQLGEGGNTSHRRPVEVALTGELTEKNFVAVAAGGYHGVMLSSDGRVYAWGDNQFRQIGDNTPWDAPAPVPVIMTGALAGKTVTAIAAGERHSLALTTEGRVYAWGFNDDGSLGDGTGYPRSAPVAVIADGALAGKRVVAIAAGAAHSAVLTEDGRLYAWGSNATGAVGDASLTHRLAPVAVDMTGALAGQTVVAISAGSGMTLALTGDGRIFAWGSNEHGQLGDGTTAHRSSPVAVKMDGALAGKTVVHVASGSYHNLALTFDGLIFAWGHNGYSQLGTDSPGMNRSEPAPVLTGGVFDGKRVIALAAGVSHNFALTADGRIFGWGRGGSGQLGHGTQEDKLPPAPVDMTGVMAGKTAAAIDAADGFSLALAGVPELAVHLGTGPSDPEILDDQVAPVGFGVVRQGVPREESLAFVNAGAGPLAIEALSLPPGFSVSGMEFPAAVPPGGTGRFRLRLDAATPGVFAGLVVISNNDADENPFSFPVTGTVITPEITVRDGDTAAPALADGQTAAVDFGRNIQGTPRARTFTISNDGTAELLLNGVTVPAGYTLSGLPPLPLTVGTGQSVTFQISLTTLAVGTHTGSVVISSDDLDEAEFDFPITGEVFIPEPVAAVVSTTTALNRQTGLREQTIHIANDTTATVPAYNLIIRGLPDGVEVNNASEHRADGSWVVYVRQAMNPRSTQDILLEYFSANRGPVEIAPQLSTEVVLNPPDLSVPGDAGFAIDRVLLQQGGALLIEFPTTPGRQYQVQYSHDGTNWQASLPAIRAAANRTQWTDRGLPRTDSHPSAHASRFYRVAELAP